MTSIIKNREALATTALRDQALSIVEAAYKSIDTDTCVRDIVSLDGKNLKISQKSYDLSLYNSIYIIGFGKASSKAAQTLESILAEAVTGGIVLDKDPLICKRVTVYKGSHPEPTTHNVEVSDKIATLASGLKEDDLAIVIVSGGGSSLLCWPQSECDQGGRLYEDFLSGGGTINELNILRKHLSGMKGGGLAKLLYPATVVGLIFCDVPGEHYETVASGPTYFDDSTALDAQKLLQNYGINEAFTFVDTPKEKKFFDKVYNVPVVSNTKAIKAMEDQAKALGYQTLSLGDECYDNPNQLIEKFLALAKPKTVIIGGGEPRMVVPSTGGGQGGRNEYLSSTMINTVPDGSVFVSFASDGIDNCSESAGGIIDKSTREKSLTLPKPVSEYLDGYQHDELLEKLNARILTGSTESNVSDLFILVNE